MNPVTFTVELWLIFLISFLVYEPHWLYVFTGNTAYHKHNGLITCHRIVYFTSVSVSKIPTLCQIIVWLLVYFFIYPNAYSYLR